MPIGNPIQFPGQQGPGLGAAGATRGNALMPSRPTRNYGGGAGQIVSNPWGAQTTVKKGDPMPSGPGKYGFGENPFTGFSPQNKAEADAQTDVNTPQGKLLKQQIEEYRRNLMQQQQQQQQM
jgi:hypothetical protein